MSRDARLSDSCTPDRCSFCSLGAKMLMTSFEYGMLAPHVTCVQISACNNRAYDLGMKMFSLFVFVLWENVKLYIAKLDVLCSLKC